MKQDLKKHILIRTAFGIIPILILASLIFFPDTQSGNSGIGINESLFLAFILLIVLGIFLLIEMFKLFSNDKVKYAVSNIGIIIFIGILYITELYLNHFLN
ncbi:hypothetical protein [Pedobacter alluvionis]|uniref:Uncharacterized protein n=1 Tax=Pedobacter alluvionis TaxID=475253 RepID=A0A497YA72_9SPHI|nr:hypothetical protein [Pedobacter alluvionis]RLJ80463.1 hypothetical protein BCL90_1238 [Pedobacter alluvionis]TFB31736.1 hypothetical protein E3V97_14230 [Pedobacter alluvionis]